MRFLQVMSDRLQAARLRLGELHRVTGHRRPPGPGPVTSEELLAKYRER